MICTSRNLPNILLKVVIFVALSFSTMVKAEDNQSLTSTLMSQLGVSEQQANGGMGALLQLAKSTLSNGEYSSLLSGIPGASDMLAAAPEVKSESKSASSLLGGFGGDSLKGLANSAIVKQQFETLGLDADMIVGFANTSIDYLQSEQGQQVVSLLKKGIAGLL